MKKVDISENLLTMKAGYWVPIKVIPTLPGDYFNIQVSDVIRDMARIAPTMSNESVRIAGFYVQNKDICDNWWNFRTGGLKNDDTSVLPYMYHSHAKGDVGFSTLTDYIQSAPALTFYTPDGNGVLQPNSQVCKSVCLVERAYYKIMRDWMMNQNIEDEDTDYPLSTESGDNGEDTTTGRALCKCHWNKDFWTKQVDRQQKGAQTVIPIGTVAKAYGSGESLGWTDGTQEFGTVYSTYYGGLLPNQVSSGAANGTINAGVPSPSPADGTAMGLSTDKDKSGVLVDLSASTGIPVSVLKLAFATEQVGIKLLQHGSRAVEWLSSMWGVKSSDARLDRSMFLGAYSSNIVISPISQTSATGATGTPQGNQAGQGFHMTKTPAFKCYCEEDGFIIILACIRPHSSYCQGLPAHYRYKTRWDYPLPMFQHLDYVSSTKGELKYKGVTNGDDSTNWDDPDLFDNQKFGNHPIFEEWRSFPDEVHGEFLNTMRYYHEARIFDNDNDVNLNKNFIQCTPTTRQFADVSADSKDNYYCQFAFKIKMRRKLAQKGTPRYS